MSRDKRNRVLIFIGAFIALILIYFLLFYSPSKRYNWSEDYKMDKDRPFGTWLVSELLQHYNSSQEFKELDEPLDYSLNKAKTPSNYIFIGEEMYLEQRYSDSLLSFVSKGNNAFIFTSMLPRSILERITSPYDKYYHENDSDLDSYYIEDNMYYYFDTVFTTIIDENLDTFNSYRFIYNSRFGTYNTNWSYVSYDNLEILNAESLGEFYGINSELDTLGGINYYKVDYGEGAFYFHTQPIQFSNIQLLDSNSLDYTNSVFAYLNEGPIYWDEYNWIFNRPTAKTSTYNPFYNERGDSPIKLILSNDTLKWGWYLLLFFILLFVIFEGKRKQAIIPVLADKQNTTLHHIKSLSKLFYNNEEHFPIAEKMFDNYLWYLRSELKVDTSKSNEKLIPEIVIKSGSDEKTVKTIFDLWGNISGWGSVKTSVFLKFYNTIDEFYNKRKNDN